MSKVRPSSNYLVIGGIHLGFDHDVLAALSNFATRNNCQVIHTGNLCTDDEYRMYENRQYKLKTWEKQELEKLKGYQAELEYAIDDVNKAYQYDEVEAIDKLVKRREVIKARLITYEYNTKETKEKAEKELQEIEEAEANRIKLLVSYFPNIDFVINDEQYLCDSYSYIEDGGGFEHVEFIHERYPLGKYMTVFSIQANGSKISNAPLTERALYYLKTHGKSAIVPHPIPVMESKEREGLNQAHNYYTTGCLYDPNATIQGRPKRPSQYYLSKYTPSAVFVLVDDESGEFHASRLFFERINCPVSKRQRAAILRDGEVYTGSHYSEVHPKDIAVLSTDDHAPYQHNGVLASVDWLTHETMCETFINLGDCANWDSLNGHNINKPLLSEGLRFSDDLDCFLWLLKEQTRSPYLKNKVLIDSNHEYWIERFCQRNPAMVGTVDQSTLYSIYIPEWQTFVRGGPKEFTYKFGDLTLRHGDREGGVRDGHRKFDQKYVCGHWHGRQEYIKSASLGSGSTLDAPYLENRINKWQNTVATVTRHISGVVLYDVKIVLHSGYKSRFAYRDKIIEVPFHQGKKRRTNNG